MIKYWARRIRKKWETYFSQATASEFKTNLLTALPFWAGSLLVGLVAVGYTKLFGLFEYMLQAILRWHSFLIFIMAPICFTVAWLIVRLFAPNAKGSGIPQVMAAIELSTPENDHKVKKLLSLRIILVKISSSLFMVLGGGAIGREGPTIQIAGSIFRVIAKLIPRSWPKLSNQSFILTGAAAGLAAAFNTPLGGVVFAIEELSKAHIRSFQVALFSAVIISGLAAQGLLGPYLYLGYPDVRGTGFIIFFGVMATAAIAGVLGSYMGKLILVVMKWKRRFNASQLAYYVLISGLVVASTAYFLDPKVLGSGKDLMSELLFTGPKLTSWHTVAVRVLGPVISFNTGAAGGVFAPSLAAGASVGAFIAGILNFTSVNANILILSGMVGFLTGVTRTPFTSAILVLEMTDRHGIIFHLMLAGLISSIAALAIDKHSLYERLKEDYMKDVMKEKAVAA